MANEKNDAVWHELDPNTLDHTAQAFYGKYKALYREAKEARESFEEAMRDAAGLPAGKKMIFGYNFGKLSVAVVADDGKGKAKPAAPKLNLAQFLAAQGASGRRA